MGSLAFVRGLPTTRMSAPFRTASYGVRVLFWSSDCVFSMRSSSTPLSGTSNNYSVNIYRDGGSGYGYFDTMTNSSYSTGVRIRTYNNTTYNNVIEHTTSKVTNFQTDGSTRLSIDSSGRVIIGKVLTAGSGPHYDDITIINSNQSGAAGSAGIDLISSNDAYGGILFSDSSANEQGYIKYWHASDADKMRFGTNNLDRWEISKDGYWIPVTDSLYDIGTNATRVRNVYTDNFYATSLSYNGNQLKFGGGSGPTSSGGYYDDIKIDNSDISSGEAGGTGIEFISGNQSWAGLIFSDSDSAQQGYVKYSHQNDYTTIAAAGAERLRLLANNIQAINCTGALTLPLGTTAQRPTAATGMIRYNSTETELEMYNGTEWLAIKTLLNTFNVSYLVFGGGGAGSAGITGYNSSDNSISGDGGSALASSITGSSVLRAGGGGAGAYGGGNSTGGGVNNGPASGGGGAGRGAYGYRTGESATANTGSGGGGSPGSQNEIGGSGGSGLIILRYSNAATATYTSGVTYTRSTIGSDVVDTITLTSNSSQTVTFS